MSQGDQTTGLATPVPGPGGVSASETDGPPRFGYRWTICALLFFATTINYIDRQVIGILGPTLRLELGWTTEQFGDVLSWFQLMYGLGFLGAGRLLDRIGVKKGFALAIVTWSLAAMSHAFARTQLAFSMARGALGLGESANFPASIKAVAEWFPRKERALATGIFNAGSNVGAIVAPIVVPIIALSFGWRYAFFFTSGLVVIWLLVWWRVFYDPERHPRVSRAELAYVRSDRTAQDVAADAGPDVPWYRLLAHRQAWGFIVAKSMTDPVWWFYLFWLPTFLDSKYGIKLSALALPLVVAYVAADFGSIFGGWLSGAIIKRGRTVNFGRKLTMLIAAILIVPTMLAPRSGTMWIAVGIVSVALASHQWWSANVFTCASDMFPSRNIAFITSIGGFGGAIIGMGFQRIVGYWLRVSDNNYTPIFLYCGLAYVTAWLILQALAPRLQPVELSG